MSRQADISLEVERCNDGVLDFSRRFMTPEDAVEAAKWLQKFDVAVTELSLACRSGTIGVSGAAALSEKYLKDTEELLCLDMSGHTLRADAWASLGVALKSNKSLRLLDVSGCFMVSDSWKSLAEGVAANPSLAILWAANGCVSPATAPTVASMLASTSTLRELNLENSSLG